jgi:hypothetical protein
MLSDEQTDYLEFVQIGQDLLDGLIPLNSTIGFILDNFFPKLCASIYTAPKRLSFRSLLNQLKSYRQS